MNTSLPKYKPTMFTGAFVLVTIFLLMTDNKDLFTVLLNPLSHNVPQCTLFIFLSLLTCLMPDDFTCQWRQLNGLTKKSDNVSS